MRIQALVYFYVRRLRTHPVQELLAGLGIAIGVALALAVLVANSSVVASADDLVEGVTGAANLQVVARDGQGFDERLVERVRAVPGVEHAAPALERRAVLSGPAGTEVPINLVSVDSSLAQLSGRLTRSFLPGGLDLQPEAMMIPSNVADRLGVPNPTAAGNVARALPTATVNVRGRAKPVTVAAVLGDDTIGPLEAARVGVMPLASLQRLAGLEGRVSRVLVSTSADQEPAVERRLERIVAGRMEVTDTAADVRLLEQATGPTDQVTGFFAAVSALLGLLLAGNAMLLTAPERRRLVSALRIQGYRRRQVAAIMLFQALTLGIVASIVGVVAGSLLSRGLFSESPEYLAPGFTLGGRTVIDAWPLVAALAGGIAMSCAASAPPLLDLRRRHAIDSVLHEPGSPGNALRPRTTRRALVASAAAFLVATVLLVAVPELALIASALLALGTLLAIPATFRAAIALLQLLVDRVPRLSTLTVTLLSLRSTTLRSLALAATGAVAVFGSVSIGGARTDLLAGIADYGADYVGTADIWVVNPFDNQATNDFPAENVIPRLRAIDGVADVRAYQGSFLDMDGRRIWVIARPTDDPAMLPASSIVKGDLDTATAALRRGGSVAVSDKIATDKGLDVGDSITVPTPTGPAAMRIVATTTNLGWAPGALMLNSADYRRRWSNTDASAIEIDAAENADPGEVGDAVAAVLRDAAPGLRAQSADERAGIILASARQGLDRLSQISLLLQIAAVLAMAAAMGAAIWQRRPELAGLRIQSFQPRQLLALLLIEAAVVLGAGGLTGAIGGTYGRIGADRFLQVVTGFPVAPAAVGWNTVTTLATVVVVALAIIAIPGWFATRVSPRLGLGAE
ncbi:MAG: ABC transporter permease [Solirubrobacterales bacterium]|nr:ABC transporter permease [Solirubrobacterales bacterium]